LLHSCRRILPDLFPFLQERDAILNCRCLNSSRSDQSISLSGNPFIIRMDDDVEKRYENMKSKKRALSSII
ncbi:hypothetical protein EJB05_49134, partial [Eragrostis curvula]